MFDLILGCCFEFQYSNYFQKKQNWESLLEGCNWHRTNMLKNKEYRLAAVETKMICDKSYFVALDRVRELWLA
jgi:hypothetical protein